MMFCIDQYKRPDFLELSFAEDAVCGGVDLVGHEHVVYEDVDYGVNNHEIGFPVHDLRDDGRDVAERRVGGYETLHVRVDVDAQHEFSGPRTELVDELRVD